MFKNQSEIEEFKYSVKKLYTLLSSLVKVWDFEAYVILKTLVQNLCSTNDCERIVTIIESIQTFSEYRGKNCYVSTFVNREIEIILTGIFNEN